MGGGGGGELQRLKGDRNPINAWANSGEQCQGWCDTTVGTYLCLIARAKEKPDCTAPVNRTISLKFTIMTKKNILTVWILQRDS